jgi:hypothetical protein
MNTTVQPCPDAEPSAGVPITSGDPSSLLISNSEAAEMLDCLPLALKYACQAIGDCGVLPAWTVSALACSILGGAPGAAFTASTNGAPQAAAFGSNLFAFLGTIGAPATYALLDALLMEPFRSRCGDGYHWLAGYPDYFYLAPIMHEHRSRYGNAILISDTDGNASGSFLPPDEAFLCSLYDGKPLERGGYDLGWRPLASIASRLLMDTLLGLYGSRRAQHSPFVTRTIPVLCTANNVTAESVTPNPALLEAYYERIQELFACRNRQFSVVMERDGAALLRTYANDCLREVGDGENYAMLRFAQQAGRLSLVFHLAKHGPGAASHALSAETIEAAIRYMRCLGRHVLAVYRYAAACETAKDDQAIIAALKLHGPKGATAWSVARKAPEPELPFIFRRRFLSEADALEALLSAVQRGIIVAGNNERFSLP